MKRFLLIFLPIAALGCGSLEPVNFYGKSLTYIHGSLGFEQVMRAAQTKCGTNGKSVKHISTSGRAEFICTFECTDSK